MLNGSQLITFQLQMADPRLELQLELAANISN